MGKRQPKDIVVRLRELAAIQQEGQTPADAFFTDEEMLEAATAIEELRSRLEACLNALERGVALLRDYEHSFGRLSPEAGKVWTDMMIERDKAIASAEKQT